MRTNPNAVEIEFTQDKPIQFSGVSCCGAPFGHIRLVHDADQQEPGVPKQRASLAGLRENFELMDPVGGERLVLPDDCAKSARRPDPRTPPSSRPSRPCCDVTGQQMPNSCGETLGVWRYTLFEERRHHHDGGANRGGIPPSRPTTPKMAAARSFPGCIARTRFGRHFSRDCRHRRKKRGVHPWSQGVRPSTIQRRGRLPALVVQTRCQFRYIVGGVNRPQSRRAF